MYASGLLWGKRSRFNKHDSSRRQTNSSDLVDRISNLPDSILGVILSFLHTKEAVATSILTKRWKFAWVTVHNLDFDFNNDGFRKAQRKGADKKFIEFVNHVLHLHSCVLLNKFRLVWNPKLISSSYSNTWINTAISKKVRELFLRCVGPYDLPINVFSCDSLHSLELTGGTTCVNDEIVICLPRLESLKISPVSFESEKACETLLSGCPLLNYLHLNICNDDFECIISSISLRRLEISFKGRYSLKGECSLKLKASSLEYLMLDGCISQIFIDKSLASLVQADFNIELDEFDFPINSIVEAVRACDRAKVLTLSSEAVQALSNATISLSRLVKLVAGTSSLQHFIHNSENLEVLIIHLGSDQDESDCDDHSKWSSLGEVPRCLSNSLKKVQLDNFTGSEDELEMIQYILKHGSVVEVMEISCYDNEESYQDFDVIQGQFELLKKICEFPRKSPTCEVRFSE